MKLSPPALVAGVTVSPPNPGDPTLYPLKFTSIAPVTFTLAGGTAAFVDLNIGGSVPAAAKVAAFVMQNNSGGQLLGVRPSGSSLARYLSTLSTAPLAMEVECSSRHIEAWDPTLGINSYSLMGYWS